jgi:hypothetical protein
MSELKEIVILNNISKNSISEVNCIICFDNTENNISDYRYKDSECVCKYNIHKICFDAYIKNNSVNCMLCRKKINNSKIVKYTGDSQEESLEEPLEESLEEPQEEPPEENENIVVNYLNMKIILLIISANLFFFYLLLIL